MRSIDLNADVGEGCGQDGALMPLISSANIACGLHAGDVDSMHEAVSLANHHGVSIGAHPSFPDREHFGRREMRLNARELHECIVAQIESLASVAAAAGTRLRHVKPHGALYNMAARDEELAEAVVTAIRSVDPALMLFGLAGSALVTVAARLGMPFVSEAFADRAYRSDGSLAAARPAGKRSSQRRGRRRTCGRDGAGRERGRRGWQPRQHRGGDDLCSRGYAGSRRAGQEDPRSACRGRRYGCGALRNAAKAFR